MRGLPGESVGTNNLVGVENLVLSNFNRRLKYGGYEGSTLLAFSNLLLVIKKMAVVVDLGLVRVGVTPVQVG